MRELLGALGLAWPRLLIYPGGLVALLGAALLAGWLRWLSAGPAGSSPDLSLAARLADLLPPLLALTLLPLPPARAFPYGLDLPTALALLAWPRLRAIAAAGGLAPERLRELAPAGGLLLLALGLLAEGAGAIELSALLREPAQPWRWALLLGGALAWLGGAARLGALTQPGAGGRLGAWGLLLVGALPLLAGLAALLAGRLPEGWAGWLLPAAAAGVAGLLVGAGVWLAGRARLPPPPPELEGGEG
jgi:hypothetical protein